MKRTSTALLILAVTLGCESELPSDMGAHLPPFDADVYGSAVLALDAVELTDFGAVGDGVTDDTAAIQAALDTGKAVVIRRPAAFYRITRSLNVLASVRGVDLPELRMDGPDGTFGKAMLVVRNHTVPELVISGLHLHGGWDGAAVNGESSHGVAIMGSRFVFVERCVIEHMEGDNVYVSAYKGVNSSDVVVRGNRLSNPRRCNVAVVGGARVRILENELHKSVDYVGAVTLEPNNHVSMVVEDIEVSNNLGFVPGSFVVLHAPTLEMGYDHPVQRILIANNTARGPRFVSKIEATGLVRDVRIVRNEFLGTEATSDAEFVTLPGAVNVTIEDNLVLHETALPRRL